MQLRTNCRCGGIDGYIKPTNGQNCVFCSDCNRFQYNAPKTETGEKQRSVSTTRELVKPKKRYAIIERANRRCEMCGATDVYLHVDHALSLDDGFSLGLSDQLLNCPENLIAVCEECNLGKGKQTIPISLLVGILRARAKRLSE